MTTVKRNSSSLSWFLVLSLAGVCAAQTTPSVYTMTFEGLKNGEGIGEYYNGGVGSMGSGPGPSFGVSFGSGALVLTNQSAGGSGNVSDNPSGVTTAGFLSGGGLVMNVPAGFTSGFSFYYAAPSSPGNIQVYDGLNATGTVLATVPLPATGGNCNGSQYAYSCWKTTGVSFSGVAKSVNFAGTANQIAFDNITIGSQTAPAPLKITTTSLQDGNVGTPYNQTVTASGGLTPYSFSAFGLPPGLSLNASTGVLSGMPTSIGIYSVSVSVSDSTVPKLTVFQSFTIGIKASTFSVTTATLPAGAVGTPYTLTLTAAGGTVPYSWSATGLPSGLSLDSAMGVISGTPTAAGTFSISVSVLDSAKLTASQSFTLVITPPALSVTITSLGNGTTGVAYSQTLTATGGTPPYSWNATGLPPGLTLNNSTGVVSGTPTSTGSFSVTISVADSSSPKLTAQQTLTLTISLPKLTLTTTSLGNGALGVAYSQTLTATGGASPYSWSATGLPAGLTLNVSTGVVSGTPTSAGSFPITVTVTDSSNPALTAQLTLTLTIIQPKLTLNTTALPNGTAGTPYSQTLTASGGTSPYQWIAGGLPVGLSLNSATGVLSGTPGSIGTFTVTITVSDSSSPALSTPQTYPLTINAPAAPVIQVTPSSSQVSAIASGSSVTVTLGVPAAADLTATLTLSFAGNAAGLPTGTYVDPGLLFSTGGTTASLTIKAGTNSATIPIQVGSVAGTITVTVTQLTQVFGSVIVPLTLQSANPNTTITVNRVAPVITSVKIINVTSSGFTVDVVASSTPRDLTNASLTFTDRSGAALTGAITYSNTLSPVATSWFASGSGQSAGGAFDLQFPFTFSGNFSSIAAVSVTLSNSTGTSAAVSGGQ